MDNIISIVGKTNVGKSTLFNFLIRKRKSIVNSKKNITKNRNYGFFYIKEKKFLLIDTGGFFFKKKNKIKNKIINNIFISIKESKLILFVVDIKYGLFNEDIKLSKILKKEKKNVFLIINKIDIKNTLFNYYDFYKLGFKKNYLISITHNIGFKKLYKDIYKFFKKKKKDKKKKKIIIILN
ncbi:MAG: 50S ribosome-binding GTPase [Candidatus Shikimatogenerans bostrichidophilus]|nr:MAG: 50S ribosome-binding GTPase [Candidatus Shikimatogenerans bostrichidophilus]